MLKEFVIVVYKEFMDEPLLMQETCVRLCQDLGLGPDAVKRAKERVCEHQNICVLLGCLAEKMAGKCSIHLLSISSAFAEDLPTYCVIFILIQV